MSLQERRDVRFRATRGDPNHLGFGLFSFRLFEEFFGTKLEDSGELFLVERIGAARPNRRPRVMTR